MAELQQHYKKTIVPALQKAFGYKSVMEVPRVTKITLNMGLGEAVSDKKIIADFQILGDCDGITIGEFIADHVAHHGRVLTRRAPFMRAFRTDQQSAILVGVGAFTFWAWW